MKKSILIILAVILLATVGLLYYLNQIKGEATDHKGQSRVEETTKKDVRELVWEQLPTQRKDEIDGTWGEGKVSKITLNENSVMSVVRDKSYTGQEVYLISFPSKYAAVLGDLIIYADVDTFDIIAYGLRD